MKLVKKNIVRTFLITMLLGLVFSCRTDDDAGPSDGENNNNGTDVILISEDIEDDTVLENIELDPTKPDYIVTDFISIKSILTIDPGVVIEFDANAGFSVDGIIDQGVLIAKGTSELPIIFTGTSKTKGFWRGIRIFTNDVRNEMDYVTLEYAGSDALLDIIKNDVRAGVALKFSVGGFTSSLKITNSTIQDVDGYRLAVDQSSCLLRSFSNNSFSNNTEASVLIPSTTVSSLDTESNYTGDNGYDGIEVNDDGNIESIENNMEWPAFLDGSSYYISSTIDVEAVLTIMPGAILEFEANTEMVFREKLDAQDGVLVADGTSENPIIFTAIKKEPGYWKGLRIQSNSNNLMNHCLIEYGGSNTIAGDKKANIGLDHVSGFPFPKLTLTSSDIQNSTGCGVAIEDVRSEFEQRFNSYSNLDEGSVCSE